MIVVHFSRREGQLCLSLNGHADHAEEGKDIVCAAVSGIFYALCGYLMNVKNKGLRIHSLSWGNADLECGEEGEEAMKMACIGLIQIMLSYPANLTVCNSAWNWKIVPPEENVFRMEERFVAYER